MPSEAFHPHYYAGKSRVYACTPIIAAASSAVKRSTPNQLAARLGAAARRRNRRRRGSASTPSAASRREAFTRSGAGGSLDVGSAEREGRRSPATAVTSAFVSTRGAGPDQPHVAKPVQHCDGVWRQTKRGDLRRAERLPRRSRRLNKVGSVRRTLYESLIRKERPGLN